MPSSFIGSQGLIHGVFSPLLQSGILFHYISFHLLFFFKYQYTLFNNMLEVSIQVKMLLLLANMGGEGQEPRYPPCLPPAMSLRLSPSVHLCVLHCLFV